MFGVAPASSICGVNCDQKLIKANEHLSIGTLKDKLWNNFETNYRNMTLFCLTLSDNAPLLYFTATNSYL
jgi:hypothetical protein